MYDIASPWLMTSQALVPEQLCDYVRAVSGVRLRFCRGMAVYLYGDEAVLIGYPPASALEAAAQEHAFCGLLCQEVQEVQGVRAEQPEAAVAESAVSHGVSAPGNVISDEDVSSAINEVSSWEGLRKLTVLAPFRPSGAPAWAVSGPLVEGGTSGDCYYSLELPFFRPGGEAPGQKLRNMLRRAGRELAVTAEEPEHAWKTGCGELVDETLRTRNLPPGTRHIYGQIRAYLEAVPGAALFTARERVAETGTGKLHGFCVGDFSALDTAFYMFAFRSAQAVPGTADLLLAALVAQAEKLGHRRVNLGLCINGGIAFFKRKWGARPFLPYLETAWELKKPGRGLLARLFRAS